MTDKRTVRERYKYSSSLLEIPTISESLPCTIDIDAEHTLYKREITQAIETPTAWQSDPIITQNLTAQNKTLLELLIPAQYKAPGVITVDIRHDNTSALSAIHLNVVLESGAESRVVVNHHAANSTQTVNALTTIAVADGSKLELVEVTQSGATLLLTTAVQQCRDSVVNISTIDIDNRQLRRNQIISLDESGAEVQLAGLYLTSANQSVDNYISVRHTKAECRSNQLYKGVIGEASTATFTGEVYVAPNAQHTEALQQNHNILLGDDSRVNSRPQLEIYADDVKCNHGATIGRTDPEAIYYMRQRGIPEIEAQRLQLEGFVSQIVDQCPISEIHHTLIETISHRLHKI